MKGKEQKKKKNEKKRKTSAMMGLSLSFFFFFSLFFIKKYSFRFRSAAYAASLYWGTSAGDISQVLSAITSVATVALDQFSFGSIDPVVDDETGTEDLIFSLIGQTTALTSEQVSTDDTRKLALSADAFVRSAEGISWTGTYAGSDGDRFWNQNNWLRANIFDRIEKYALPAASLVPCESKAAVYQACFSAIDICARTPLPTELAPCSEATSSCFFKLNDRSSQPALNRECCSSHGTYSATSRTCTCALGFAQPQCGSASPSPSPAPSSSPGPAPNPADGALFFLEEFTATSSWTWVLAGPPRNGTNHGGNDTAVATATHNNRDRDRAPRDPNSRTRNRMRASHVLYVGSPATRRQQHRVPHDSIDVVDHGDTDLAAADGGAPDAKYVLLVPSPMGVQYSSDAQALEAIQALGAAAIAGRIALDRDGFPFFFSVAADGSNQTIAVLSPSTRESTGTGQAAVDFILGEIAAASGQPVARTKIAPSPTPAPPKGPGNNKKSIGVIVGIVIAAAAVMLAVFVMMWGRNNRGETGSESAPATVENDDRSYAALN
jgi:hypothetical protein